MHPGKGRANRSTSAYDSYLFLIDPSKNSLVKINPYRKKSEFPNTQFLSVDVSSKSGHLVATSATIGKAYLIDLNDLSAILEFKLPGVYGVVFSESEDKFYLNTKTGAIYSITVNGNLEKELSESPLDGSHLAAY